MGWGEPQGRADHGGHTIDVGPVTVADPIDTPLIPYTRNKLHFLASSAVTDNGRSTKVSVGASNVLQLLDVFTNLETEVGQLRTQNAALAAALEDIAGMLDLNRLEVGKPPDWRATAMCASYRRECHVVHPDDPGEWCGVCVAEVAWCAWKMGTLG